MKKVYVFVVVCLSLVLSVQHLFATHAAGGELIYELIPGQTNQYKFTFKFYRDCAGTGEPATFQLCYNNSCGVVNQSITLSKIVGNLPNGQPNGGVVLVGCNPLPTICNGGVLPGYREWWYTGNVTLPTTCNFWKFWVTLCCRNTGINNLVNSGAQSIFVETTFNNTTNLNSSPSILSSPIAYYCVNMPSYAYYTASDPDGDSLDYESVNPQTNPAGCGTYAPTNIFQAPYTSANPFPSGFFINQFTGLISFNPTALGKWVFTVRVKEYRNGQLIGYIMRDIQFVVSNCNLPNPLYVLGSFTPILCNGGTTTLQAFGFGGILPYQYKLNAGAYQASNQFTGVTAGVYTITIKDAQQCTMSSVVNITQPAPILVAAAAVPIACNGGTTTIFAIANNGLLPYQYKLQGGAYQFSNQFNNVVAGPYVVTAKDANNCTGNTLIIITQPPPIVINVANAPIPCTGLANLLVTANGGFPAFQFSLNGGPYQLNGNFNNLIGGIYTVTVKDANNCTNSSVVNLNQTPAITLTVNNITNVTCNPLCNGSAQASSVGGVLPYTYAITAPGIINANTGAMNGLCAGIYTVTVTDAQLCTKTASFVITQPQLFIVAISNITNVTCNPLCNGSAQATGVGGSPVYTYSITAPGVINANTGAIISLCAGNYTVSATDANGCTASTIFSITQPPVLTLAISNIANVTCNPLCNGTAQAISTGGTPGYSFAITAPGVINFTGAISALCAGAYTVTVTDANGCTKTTSFAVTQPPPLTISISNITNIVCSPQCNGTAQATPLGGTPAYSYAITAPGVISGGGAITALCAGTYTVTVTDANLCTASTIFVVTQPPILTVSISNIGNITCAAPCSGTAQAASVGGVPGYSYSITAPGAINITGAITALCAGTYTVTVTDASLCTATTTFNVVQPPLLSVVVSNINNVTCNGLCNGAAQAIGVGGTPAYTYAITAPGVINVNTGAITALCVGTYTVTVTDANLCTGTTTFTITEPAVLSVAVSNITNVTCNPLCNGTAQATGAGGTAVYTYAITAPGAININSGAITALCAGSYTVTVTDANFCTATTVFTVTQPTVLSVAISNITNVSCNPLCNGTAQATGSGGTVAYTYAITAPGVINVNSGAITGLCAGTYTVTVTDANLCTATTTFSVTQPVVLSVTTSNITNVTCNGLCNGTAQATGAGGTVAYTYSITAPGIINVNSGVITALCAGTYTVTVTDANLCTATTTFTVSQPTVLSVTTSNITNVTCNGLCNGTAQATGGGGTPAYTYAITAPGVINVNTGAITALCVGTYTVTVTDANLCTGTTTFSVTEPVVLSVTTSNVTNVTCNPLCNGTAQATGAGGTAVYTYAITAPGAININSGAITALCAGSYTVTVTDANFCTATTVFTVTQPTVLSVAISNITNVSCNPLCNGTAQATGSGGTVAYTYAITAPGVINVNSGAITGLCAGTYTVTVTDANLCTATTTFSVTQPVVLSVTTSNITNVTCNGLCNGTAQATGAGGTVAYTYSITAPGIINVNSGVITALCAGTYTVTVTDANLCTATTTFTVSQPTVLSVTTSNITNVTCNGLCNGTAQATGGGGTPAYTYAITAPGVINVNTGAITALCVGTYTVTVTDANLCTGTTTFSVTEPVVLSVTTSNVTNAICNGQCNGTAQATGAGGTAAYTYAITAPGIINVNTGAISALCAGSYTVTVTDANLCTATTVFIITEPTAVLTTVASSTDPTCTPGCDGTVTVTGAGGNGLIVFTIFPAAGPQLPVGTFTGLCAGTNYVITGTDANGCTGTTNISLSTPNAPTVTVSNITNVSCNGVCDGTAQAAAIGGTPGYTYSITAPGIIDVNTGAITGLCAGNYTVTVTDANSCVGTTNFVVTEPVVLTVVINTSTAPTCVPGCDGTATTTTAGGTPAYAYAISGGAAIDALGNASNLCAGIVYTITVTDANSCSATATIQLIAPSSPTITINTSTAPTCVPGCDGTATTTTAGGTPAYAYAISGGAAIDALGNASNLCAGIVYTITVTDANACTGTTTVQLIAPNSPTVAISNITDVTCNGLCNGTAQATGAGGLPAYTYAITAPGVINVNTGAITALCVGTYTVTVTDANLCTGTTTFSVTEPVVLSVTTSNVTNAICNGQCNGTAQATGAGGTAAYTYAITAPGIINVNTGAISALCAGSYTVTVTDANLCTATTVFIITEPTAVLTTVASSTDPSCTPGCDGTVTVTGAGGNGLIVFTIFPAAGPQLPVGTFTGLCAGTNYVITGTDANGCTGTTNISLSTPNAPTVTVSNITNVSCNGVCDGTAQAAAIGGTPGYTYSITVPGIIDVNTGAITGLCAGNYTVTVTDANSCVGTTNFVVTEPAVLTLVINTSTAPTCVPGCDGTATTTTAGGTPAYAYAISGGAAIDALGNASNLCAGIVYTITVTDANSCSATATIQLIAPSSPTITINTSTAPTCVPGCDGTATTTTAGGNPAYAYAISGGAAIDALGNASNLCAGIVYTITVTDANACTGTTTVQLIAPNSPTVAISNITDVTCNGLCNGTAQATGAGGLPAYTYAITAPGVINVNTGAITALCVGTYTVTVTDANLCTGTTTFSVTEPVVLSVTTSNVTNAICNGQCNGTAQATGAGGTAAYTYAITAPGIINVNTGAISALCAGSYTVTVTDANLCTATTVFIITEPTAVLTTVASSTDPSCTPGCDGTVTVTGAGGNGLIVFTIFPAAGPQLPVGTFTGLCAGTNYVITGTDANGCTGTTNISLSTPNAPTVTVSNITNVSCNGVCDGTAQAAAIGGTPGYTYSITVPGIIDVNTGAITGLCAGNYTVTVTDANSCVGTTNFVVTEPAVLTLVINTSTAPTCVPGCDGTATTTTAGGTPAYAYAISGGAAIDALGNASNLCAGIVYTITVTDANSCSATATIQLIAPSSPTITINTSTAPTCVPGCDGTATTTTAGGNPAYAYAISGGAAIDALGNASNLCAGIVYTITVTDANACTGTTTVQLIAPNSPTVAISNITDVTCNGLCNGTAQATGAGGLPAYTYAITAPGVINVNTGAITALCVGTYTVTVTDANLCTGTTTFSVTEPVVLSVTTSNVTNAICNGQCNGTAQATGAGGTAAYTYAITAPGIINVNTGAISALCAGSYTVTVTDANLCTATTVFSITEPTAVLTTVASSTDPSCTPGCDGTVTVTGAGGNGLIVFTIFPAAGPQLPVGTFTGLCAGTNYVITGTDANGCTGTTNISLSTPNAPTVTVSNITNVSCNGVCDGTAQAAAIGGTPGYTYSITVPGIIDVNTGAITGLCAGNYTVTVTDANSCVGTTNFVVTEPAVLTVVINTSTAPTCVPGCDGTATTTTAGGTPAYAYAISGGAAIDALGNASNLCAGIVYTITVTDANSCSATATIQLIAPSSPTITINTSTAPTCVPGCDGTATTTTAGGTPAYAYAISGGAAIDALGNASNLCAGIVYTITVTDANSCSATTTVQLIAPNSPTITINTTTPVTCVPGCDGTATTTTIGGNPAYAYAISGGAAIDALGNASNLCAGIVYTITVTDANGCSATTTIQLIAPNSPTITINTTTPVTCVPGCDGTATTVTVGGNPAYAYAISGGATIDALGNASNLCAGIVYTITVTDANACTGTTTVQLIAPNSPTITINTTTPVTCVPGCDGTATTTTIGGNPAYAYAISGGAAIDALGNASNLCAGIVYTITVTDANACTGTTTVQLIAPNSPTITINTTTPVTCVPGCDGTATTTIVGGNPAYIYAISGGAAIDALGNASNLCAGIVYTITVTDASACTGTTTVQLTAPSSPTVTVTTSTAPSCTPGCDGTVTVTGAGGNGLIVFTIFPAAGPQLPVGTFTGLCAGTNYVITGTDANGCTGTTNISLSTPNAPTVTVSNITNVSCNGVCDGTAQAAAIGGTPGYTYSITAPGIIDVNTGAITGLCAGNYTVTVTDANSCVGTTNFVVTEPVVLTVVINTSTAPTCVPGCDGTATTTTAGGTPAYAYAISGGAAIDALGNASNLCAGIVYTITVTDANSCNATTTIQLIAPNSPTITINTSTAPTCVPGCDGTATTTTAGGTPAYAYAISGGAAIDALGNASNLCAGIVYTITVTDANACTGTTTVQLIAPNSPTITINTTTPVTCAPGCDGTATTTTIGGNPAYAYAISGGAAIDALGNASNLCAGIVYTITVTDANSCSATTTIQLIAPNSPTITINTTTLVTCVPGCDGTATTTTIGGNPAYAYAISGGAAIDALGNASNLCAGIVYTITVTDANACTGTTTVQLIAPNSPTITINTTTPVTCVPGCDGTATTTTIGGNPAYAYAISGGAAIDVLGNASNLCAGIVYTITVADANGCSATTTIQLSTANAPVITINTSTVPSCVPGCDGTATTTVVGGNPVYVYAISGGANINAIGTASNLCVGTIYTITVTDGNGCTASTTIQLGAANAPTVTVTAFMNVTVFGGSDGTITVAGAGGTPGYLYTISPAIGVQAPAGNFTNLTANPGPTCYTITVTDANGCTATTVQCITQPPIPNLVVTGIPTDETCFGKCDGIITSGASGGAAPYNYVLTPGNIPSGTGIYPNLCVGTYTITATDINNATGTTVVNIMGPTIILWNNATATNISCFGAGNGIINVNATGGTGLITYTINPLGPQPNLTGTYTGLTPQCYTITATDASGCSITTTLCIVEPPMLSFGVVVSQDNTCSGGQTGTITTAAIGGNPLPNYTYVLTPGGQANQTGQFTGLGAGTYTVTVTDGNGCTATTGGIVINEPLPIVFNTVNLHEVYCYGQATGSIAVVASGGTGIINFSITPNATQLPLGFFKDLLAGTYVITATDANGCTLTTQATIVQNPELRITSLTVVEPICAYDTTGVLDVTATGGTAPILFSLNNGIPKLTGLFTGLPVGVYKITLIDNLGCSKDTNLVLSGPTLVGATFVIDDTKCIDSKDGRVTVVGTGGRGGYKYYVTPGLNINKTGRFYDLAAGTYTLRVVDTVGCEYMTVFTINPPSNPLGNTMTKQDLACTGKGNEGTATANVFGGEPPYVYEWSTSPVQSTAMASSLYFGWYNVLIADRNGCEYRDSVYIEEGPCCDVSFIPTAFSPNGDNNNDEFRVFSTAGILLIQLEIYDRWGQKLWSTADWKRGWDGTVDGEEAEVSTYFYVFRYTCTRDGKTYIRKGDVTLIR